jgi:hypothetical protein
LSSPPMKNIESMRCSLSLWKAPGLSVIGAFPPNLELYGHFSGFFGS